ncbi:hypothetical protein ABW21_db0200158 [Orbilia brochopaga]|nr:hypothetical protein ABW21_db0200158 [Drechslerella brochopaga]
MVDRVPYAESGYSPITVIRKPGKLHSVVSVQSSYLASLEACPPLLSTPQLSPAPLLTVLSSPRAVPRARQCMFSLSPGGAADCRGLEPHCDLLAWDVTRTCTANHANQLAADLVQASWP